MKKMVILILYFIALSCEEPETDIRENMQYQSVEMECLIGPSPGESIEARIDSQQEYDSLFNHLVTQPLKAYISANYNQWIGEVKRNYPNATESEYDSILRNDYVYTRFPWIEKGCELPSFNFSQFTLLRIRTDVSGCCSK